MKLLLRIVLVVVFLALLVLGATFFFLDPIVGSAIGRGATYATGVETTVSSVDVGLTKGSFDLNGMTIANPPGFTSPHFLSIGTARARWENGTLFSERIEMPELVLDGFDVHLDRNASGSNWSKILEHLDQVSGAKSPGQEPSPETKGTRALRVRRIVLDHVKVSLHLADVPLGAGTHALELPRIVIEDFQSDGSTLELVSTLTRAIVTAVLDQSVKSGGGVLPKDILKDLDGGLAGLKKKAGAEAKKLLDQGLEGGVKKALEGVEGLFDKKK
ncbi:MAG: hypothetical protein IPJ77_16755 [Planctomycetes bacterium]|nr:hypothetical protein [Planctomycetota bacterium]